MRLIAPQDRAAVEAWIADQADVQRGREIIASLPSLKTGEGWLWAPELDVLERIKFPKITTFDSSRSPDGESGAEIVLAPINLEAIQGKLAAIKQQKIANDPASLKRQVAELHRQLAEKQGAPSPTAPDKLEIQRAYAEGFRAGQESYGTAFQSTMDTMAAKIFREITEWPMPNPGKMPKYDRVPPTAAQHPQSVHQVKAKPVAQPSAGLTGPQTKILNSLRFWRTMGHDTPSREQVAGVAGYSAGGGSFQNTLSQLRTAGHIDYPGNGSVKLISDAGEAMTVEDAQATLRSILTGPQQKIIAAFNGHDAMSREDVAQDSGYEAGGGTTFR